MNEKVRIKPNAFGYPMPTTLVGVNIAGRANFLAIGWVGRVNVIPPMVSISVNHIHHSIKGLAESGTFSINVPGADMLEVTDYCGLVSGRDVDKSALFDVFYGKLETAPMIRQCPVCMECQITQTVELPSNNVYIAEIKAAYSEKKYLDENRQPDIKKINPICLTMMDRNYWALGEHLGKAWNIGKNYDRK